MVNNPRSFLPHLINGNNQLIKHRLTFPWKCQSSGSDSWHKPYVFQLLSLIAMLEVKKNKKLVYETFATLFLCELLNLRSEQQAALIVLYFGFYCYYNKKRIIEREHCNQRPSPCRIHCHLIVIQFFGPHQFLITLYK